MSIHKGVGEEGEKGGREEGGNRKGKRRERTLLTKKNAPSNGNDTTNRKYLLSKSHPPFHH